MTDDCNDLQNYVPNIVIFQQSPGTIGIDISYSDDNLHDCAKLIINTIQGEYSNLILQNLLKDKQLARLVLEMLAQQKLAEHLHNNMQQERAVVPPQELWNKLQEPEI